MALSSCPGGARTQWPAVNARCGDQRGGAQIAAGGFDLADGLPRLGGGIRDLDSFIFAEKQTRLLGLGRSRRHVPPEQR